MVVSVLPEALIASTTARPSGSEKPPSIRIASLAPDSSTGARKKPRSPAGRACHCSGAAPWAWAPPREKAAPAAAVWTKSRRVIMGVLSRLESDERIVGIRGVKKNCSSVDFPYVKSKQSARGRSRRIRQPEAPGLLRRGGGGRHLHRGGGAAGRHEGSS